MRTEFYSVDGFRGLISRLRETRNSVLTVMLTHDIPTYAGVTWCIPTKVSSYSAHKLAAVSG